MVLRIPSYMYIHVQLIKHRLTNHLNMMNALAVQLLLPGAQAQPSLPEMRGGGVEKGMGRRGPIAQM